MPYLAIDDFKAGLDTRKSVLTAPAGSLTILQNAAVSPGGEIQKRRGFIKVADLKGTTGLAALGSKVIAFTYNEDKTAPDMGMQAAQLEYHKLPTKSKSLRQTDYEIFDGNVYVVFNDKNPPEPDVEKTVDALPDPVHTGQIWLATSTGKYSRWTGKIWAGWQEDITLPYWPGGQEGYTFTDTAQEKNYKFTRGSFVLMPYSTTGTSLPPVTSYKVGDFFYQTDAKQTYILTAGVAPAPNTWVAWNADARGPTLPTVAKNGDIFHNSADNTNWELKDDVWIAWAPSGSAATLPEGIKDGTLYKLTTDGKIYIWVTDKWELRGITPADYNPHFYYDGPPPKTDPKDPYKPEGKYVLTEGSGKGYYIRAYQGKMYSVTDRMLYFSAIKYPKLWEEPSELPPSGATPVSVRPVSGVENEYIIIAAEKKCYTWKTENGVGNWTVSDPSAEDLLWIDEKTQRTGCGYMDTAVQESGGVGLLGLEIYYDKLAVMSDQTTQLWSMDVDPNQNALAQVLRNTGTRAAKSVLQYGSGDVLFLASSGIRSLKARDASNSAAVTDIGSPVDRYVRGLGDKYDDWKPGPRVGSSRIMSTSGLSYLANCQSVNEPVIGRFWACFPNEILVLSYFPGPSITAWSVYTVPFIIDYVVTAGDTIFIRSGDDLYAFGGKTGVEYDDCEVVVRFPFLDGGKPGHNKLFEALDVTVEGTWQASVAYNFDLPDMEEPIGEIGLPTWNKGRFALQGYASHVSMRFYHKGEGPATLSNAAIHYRLSDDEA